MSKTLEEIAEEYLNRDDIIIDAINHDAEDLVKLAFLAGYKAGCELTDQEIVDILVDMRKREAEENNKLPSHQQQRYEKIYEKIKVKMTGIL
jgi:predicted metal-dependent TIM-barrel fold hydrolase